jgi:hypothetical protein
VSRVPPQIVAVIKQFYHSRKDQRFLVPIITHLSKDELFEALPRLVLLHKPTIVQWVERVLGASIVAPQELLRQLHFLDSKDKSEIRKVLGHRATRTHQHVELCCINLPQRNSA